MGDSKIEWTGSTWNPVRGCTKISPGCKNCYAETFAERWRGIKGHPYEQGFDLRLVPDKLEEPLKWKKPRRVFVNSMSDLFQDGVPFEFIDRVFAVMALTPRHTYQVLTKRPEIMRYYVDGWLNPQCARCSDYQTTCRLAGHYEGYVADRVARACGAMGFSMGAAAECNHAMARLPLPNVWLGVSVEDRKRKDRIDILREIPAAVRFVSVEPLLEDIGEVDLRGIHWVIIGGESGPGARPFNIQWARDVIRQCRDAQVACFVKQLGTRILPPGSWDDFIEQNPIVGEWNVRIAETPATLRTAHSKGGDIEEWPEDLRVREFPHAH